MRARFIGVALLGALLLATAGAATIAAPTVDITLNSECDGSHSRLQRRWQDVLRPRGNRRRLHLDLLWQYGSPHQLGVYGISARVVSRDLFMQ